MTIALKGRDAIAILIARAIGESPHILACQVLGVGQLDVEFNINIVDDHGGCTLLSDAQHRSDIINEQGIGAGAYSIDRQGHLIEASLGILV